MTDLSASPYRALLQQIVDSGLPSEDRGVAFYRRAQRFLADSGAEDRQFHYLMTEMLAYTAARRQRVHFSNEAESLYLALEALIDARPALLSSATKTAPPVFTRKTPEPAPTADDLVSV